MRLQVKYDFGAQLQQQPDITFWAYFHADAEHSITKVVSAHQVRAAGES